MIYKDNLQRFLFENISVRGEFIRLNKSYQTIIDQHQYPPAINQLLGEALAVVNLLTAIIKFKGRLTVQFQGKGDLKLLLAQCNHEFQFRGVAQWKGNPSHEELLEALKQGTIAIIIDPETMTGQQRYQGIVSWQGHSLAQSIEGYFRDSEQLPTRIWLAVNKTDAVGFLLQIMPKNDSTETDNADWEHVMHLADTLTSEELLEHDNTTLLHRLYHQEEIRIFEPVPVEFRCTCSVERSENAMLLLGYEEVKEELLNKQQIVVTCEFCNKEYAFSRADIERIFNKGGNSTSQVH
jgi:molecular chaperone Hsp33